MPSEGTLKPLSRRTFQACELMEQYPPRWEHLNKEVVYQLACPPGTVHAGEVVYTRWPPATVPETLEASVSAPALEAREDVFTYDPPPAGPPAVDWHLNFAASDLFCAYGSRLLAQDEMQVAEHPVLGSLRRPMAAGAANPPSRNCARTSLRPPVQTVAFAPLRNCARPFSLPAVACKSPGDGRPRFRVRCKQRAARWVARSANCLSPLVGRGFRRIASAGSDTCHKRTPTTARLTVSR